jgi:hypothetical protein
MLLSFHAFHFGICGDGFGRGFRVRTLLLRVVGIQIGAGAAARENQKAFVRSPPLTDSFYVERRSDRAAYKSVANLPTL